MVLAAIALNGEAVADLTGRLGITGRKTSDMIEMLTRCCYLETRDHPEGPERRETSIADRGRTALNVTMDGLRVTWWADLPFRQGDIIISTPPKCGTTWMQMICTLLVFQTPDLPASLGELSIGLDWRPRGEMFTRLASLTHRRVLKTHLALSEVPIDARATYIVVARDPLDAAISFYHQNDSVRRMSKHQRARQREPDPPHEWLLRWIDGALLLPRELPDSLPGLLWRLSEAWARRDEPNVVLVHYEDLCADLAGEMRRLAARLGITVPGAAWPALIQAATFEQMRAAAGKIQPLGGALKANPAAFFRKGGSGSGRALLTSAELAHYHELTARLAPPDLLAWLHRQDSRTSHPAASPVTTGRE
jgi:aryl sulfotransferase